MGAAAALYKLRWGMRSVGVAATARGALRYARVRLRRPPSAVVEFRSGGSLEMALPGQLVPALVVFGDLIDPEYAFLRRLELADRMLVDVGAAIGQFTVFAARCGAFVHACEPSPANLATLRANIARNDVSRRVSVHGVALSDAPGRARFPTAARTYMSRLDGAAGSAPQDTVEVEVATLPEALTTWGIGHVDVLKLNVAGYEPAVLRGARPAFAAGHIDVLVTLIGTESLPWYDELHAAGYRFFFYEPAAGRLHEVDRFDRAFLEWRPSPARHVLAVRAGAIAAGLLDRFEIDRSRITRSR